MREYSVDVRIILRGKETISNHKWRDDGYVGIGECFLECSKLVFNSARNLGLTLNDFTFGIVSGSFGYRTDSGTGFHVIA